MIILNRRNVIIKANKPNKTSTAMTYDVPSVMYWVLYFSIVTHLILRGSRTFKVMIIYFFLYFFLLHNNTYCSVF